MPAESDTSILRGCRSGLGTLAACLCVIFLLISCAGDNGSSPGVTPGRSPSEVALQTLPPVTLYAADAGDQAGAVTAGDFNGDGTLDVALAAAFADGPKNERPDAGEVYVFLGPFAAGGKLDAAAGDQGFTVYGALAGDQAGRALASGDFDADGVDDLVMGSPAADGPDGARPDAGRVDVIFGSRNLGAEDKALDLAVSSPFVVYGASPGDLAGFAVDTAKLDRDAAADLVIGAFWAAGPGDSRPMAGEVYGIYGGPSRRASEIDLALSPADVTVIGAIAEDRLGEGVAAGDINGDGLDDMVLPAPFATGAEGAQDAGRTYVLASPLPPTVDLGGYTAAATVYGIDEGDQLGHVTAVGDVNGDGREDIVLTAVSADGPGNGVDLAGEVVVILNGSLNETVSGAAGQADHVIYGARSNDRLGRSVAIGDIDGDGIGEILAGAPGAAGTDGAPRRGKLYVLDARHLGLEASLPASSIVYTGLEAAATLASEIYGRMPVHATDLDGDGREEIIVAAPLGDGPRGDRPECGQAVILFITP